MPIFKIQNDTLVKLTQTSFESEKIYEVKNLQKYLVNSINVIDPKLKVISTEFSDWEDSNRSIDILCIDLDANIVVIEIKRTRDGGHMELQALRYSAMVANMKFETLIEIHQKYLANNFYISNAEDDILKFLNWSERLEEEFNKDVKIILISANFSKEITTSVLWLNDREIDIRCFKMMPYKDRDTLYFDLEQIIPLPEAADYQVKLKEKVAEERKIRIENKRAVSIIRQLFELKKLHIGQIVRLKSSLTKDISPKKVSAKIVRDGQNCLQREGDNNFYSFSKLRAVLTKELNLTGIKPDWGFTLKTDWTTENGTELAQL